MRRLLSGGGLLPDVPPSPTGTIKLPSLVYDGGTISYTPSSDPSNGAGVLNLTTSAGLELYNEVDGSSHFIIPNVPDPNNPFAPGELQLQLAVDSSGNLASTQPTVNLTLSGVIDENDNGMIDAGEPSGVLLTASVTAFGYDFSAPNANTYPMNFKLKATGGWLFDNDGTDFGGTLGMSLIMANTGGTPSFAAPFSGTDQGAIGPIVTTSPAVPQIATVAAGKVVLGSGATLNDTATLTGGNAPGGTITFVLRDPNNAVVYTDVVTVSGNGQYSTAAGNLPGGFLPTLAGTYQWSATYSGDANNAGPISDNGQNESEVVCPASPSLVTTPSTTSVSLGATQPPVLKDSAVLSGGYKPGGSIVFTLVAPGGATVDTETVTVTGNGTYTTPNGYTLPTSGGITGTYQWNATYTSADGNNKTASDTNNATERVIVTAASPSIVTTAGGAVTIGSPTKLTDTAVLTGGYLPTGSITFTLYNAANQALYTDTVTVSGNGPYSTATGTNPGGYLPTVVGSYHWVATYSGDANNGGPINDPGGPSETQVVNPASPAITTNVFVNATTGTGQFATIGFWHNKNGQALIKSFDGGATKTLLGSSLAGNFKNLFGYANPYTSAALNAAPGAAPGLAGLTNAQVASVYLNLWTPSGQQKNTFVQAFAVALGLYSTGGQGTFNVGANGVAFGVTDGSNLPISQILAAASANFNPATGLFYGGDATKTGALNTVLNNINTAGEQPGGIPTAGAGEKLNDSATLTGGYNETGTVTFYLFAPGVTPNATYSNNVYADVVTINGNGTYSTAAGTNPGGYTPLTVGTYQWVAVYSGDASNAPVTSPYGSEPQVVGQQSPTVLVTTPNLTSVTLGSSGTPIVLKDTATLTGGTTPGGTITFTLVGPGGTVVDTETVTVNGNGDYTVPTGYTLPTTGTVTGTYQWNASYSGDANNVGDDFLNDPSERTTVCPATPAINTIPGAPVLLGSGNKLTDSATLTGGYYEKGTVTFYLFAPGVTPNATYSNNVYADVVTVNGNGTYSTATGTNPGGYTPTLAGTYQWVAVYGGDANNASALGAFGCEPETVTAPGTISGNVYCDNNLNGLKDANDAGEAGAIVSLYDSTNVLVATKTTDANGNYSFTNLAPGTYTLKLTTPSSGHLAELSHGTVVIPASVTATVPPATTSSVNFAEVDKGSISGFVYDDLNDGGCKDGSEPGIANVTVTLTGKDYLGNTVTLTAITNSSGAYTFSNLLPSNSAGYTLTETQPAGYQDGLETVGTINGVTVGSVCSSGTTCGTCSNGDSITAIVLPGCNNDGINYNFGELGIHHGLTATIGFWHNKNGQSILNSFGCASNGLSLANWLAVTYPNLFGKNAPAFNVNATTGTNLTNRSNADVAAYFMSLFGVTGQKSYAQVLATAFAVFTTTNSLNTGAASRSLATKFGFILSNTGTGAASVAVPPADGAAFGLSTTTTTTTTITNVLSLANKYAVAGKLNNGNTTLITETNDVFNAINNSGDIGYGMALVTSGSGGTFLVNPGDPLGHVYAGTYLVSIDTGAGPNAAAERADIEDALARYNASLVNFGVVLAEAPPEISATADIQIHLADTSAIGGVAQGVLGVTQAGGVVTIVNGWDYSFATDAAAVAPGQYDFETVVSHEIGHALGLAHSPDSQSVMFPSLATGVVRRDLTATDIASINTDADVGTPEALMAVPPAKATKHKRHHHRATHASVPAATTVFSTKPLVFSFADDEGGSRLWDKSDGVL